MKRMDSEEPQDKVQLFKTTHRRGERRNLERDSADASGRPAGEESEHGGHGGGTAGGRVENVCRFVEVESRLGIAAPLANSASNL